MSTTRDDAIASLARRCAYSGLSLRQSRKLFDSIMVLNYLTATSRNVSGKQKASVTAAAKLAGIEREVMTRLSLGIRVDWDEAQ